MRPPDQVKPHSVPHYPKQPPPSKTAYNYYICFFCGTYVCFTDTVILVMMLQIIGHLIALRSNLTCLTDVKYEDISEENNRKLKSSYRKFDYEEMKEIYEKLKDVIDHHRLIDEFAKDMRFFSLPLGINYFCHLIICCLSLLQFLQGDLRSITRYGPETSFVFGQLIQISILFELAHIESEKLPNELYFVSWERMDVRTRRVLHIFLHRLQTPIVIKAAGIIPVGVETMAKILKTTFSTLTFLKSIQDG
ncbi:odorant receptor 22b-like [Battus philenor]|uniref:odorant receptor 22b-like n=1 Tax=Battus philenor TaxID=42288 RepID=UPI0035D0806D